MAVRAESLTHEHNIISVEENFYIKYNKQLKEHNVTDKLGTVHFIMMEKSSKLSCSRSLNCFKPGWSEIFKKDWNHLAKDISNKLSYDPQTIILSYYNQTNVHGQPEMEQYYNETSFLKIQFSKHHTLLHWYRLV